MSPRHPLPVTPPRGLIGLFPVQTSWGQSGCGMRVSPFPTPSGFFCSCLSPANCPRVTGCHQHQISPCGHPGMSPVPGPPPPGPQMGDIVRSAPSRSPTPCPAPSQPQKNPRAQIPAELFPGGSVCAATTLVTRRSLWGQPGAAQPHNVPMCPQHLRAEQPWPCPHHGAVWVQDTFPAPRMSPPNVTPADVTRVFLALRNVNKCVGR